MVKKKIQKIQTKRRLRKKEDISINDIPRITNDNLAQHREDVIRGAKKYKFPVAQSKRRIVQVSVGLLLSAVMAFLIISVLLLYRFQNTSDFMYQVSRVIPFPIARTGTTFIAYEDYLFELKHYIYFYENKQDLSFDTEIGSSQLDNYKQRALEKVVNDAYIRTIAEQRGISVSEEEIDEQLRIAREQNRLGSSQAVFEDVLKNYWNWTIDDFRRSLRGEILSQKVASAIDTEARQRAEDAKKRIEAGEDFVDVAIDVSDDQLTKDQGGDFGQITKSNRNISQQAADVLFSQEPGEISDVVTVPYGRGYAFALIRTISKDGNNAIGAHIIIQIKSIEETLNEVKEEKPYRLYMNPEAQQEEVQEP